MCLSPFEAFCVFIKYSRFQSQRVISVRIDYSLRMNMKIRTTEDGERDVANVALLINLKFIVNINIV